MSLVRSSKMVALTVAALTLIGSVGTAFADNNQYTTGKGGRMGNDKMAMMKSHHMHYKHHKHHMKKMM